MKKLLLALIIFFNIISYSQEVKIDTIKKVYVSIKHYKKNYSKYLTKEDSLNFMFRGKDTLVLVKNYIKPKGISVPYEYKDSTFLHYYKKIVYNYTDNTINKKSRMRYWKEGISIYFSKTIPKKTKKQLMFFAKSIAKQVDSLKIKEVKRVEDSNYVIYCFGDYEYESRLTNYKHSEYYAHWNNQNQIYKSSIKINLDEFFNEKH